MKLARIFPIILAVLVLTACDGRTPTVDPVVQAQTAAAETMEVQTLLALSVQETLAVLYSPTPEITNTPLPSETPQFTSTPTLTSTPTTPRVIVSKDTNCRFGPGTMYQQVGSLMVGQTADVVGKSTYSDFWVIRLPNEPQTTCWLWGQYASVAGDTSQLPVYQPPPTPTPTHPVFVMLNITNSSSDDIYFIYIKLADAGSWGGSLISEVLNIGQTLSFELDPGVYDVKLELSDHTVAKTWEDVNLTQTDKTLVLH